jgi:hypothetical protein
MYEMRDILNRIPGITTFMTLQSLCVVLHVSYTRLTNYPTPKFLRLPMIALIIACILRAWLWSERLAILELIIPVAIIRFSPFEGRKQNWRVVAPLIGAIVVFGIFCADEYFRSWQYYKLNSDYSFFEFAWVRFAGYYATALNNGASVFSLQTPYYQPFMTAGWFYSLPVWSFLGTITQGDPAIDSLMELYLNPEFNNWGGIFMPYVDYGVILGTGCWMVLGSVSGILFNSFAFLRVPGLIIYPVWYIGILEMLGIFYWADSRFFLVLIGSLLLALVIKAQMRGVATVHNRAVIGRPMPGARRAWRC